MTSITLMFFENVTVRFFDAALFRRLNGNFLEEDEHIGEQTTLEFGLLRRQIRRQFQRSRVNQTVVRHFETILKMLKILVVGDLNVEIGFDLFQQGLLFLLQPGRIHPFENQIGTFDAARQLRRFDRIVRDELLHRFEQHFVLSETRHDARKVIFQCQTTAQRIQFAQLSKSNRNRDENSLKKRTHAHQRGEIVRLFFLLDQFQRLRLIFDKKRTGPSELFAFVSVELKAENFDERSKDEIELTKRRMTSPMFRTTCSGASSRC